MYPRSPLAGHQSRLHEDLRKWRLRQDLRPKLASRAGQKNDDRRDELNSGASGFQAGDHASVLADATPKSEVFLRRGRLGRRRLDGVLRTCRFFKKLIH